VVAVVAVAIAVATGPTCTADLSAELADVWE